MASCQHLFAWRSLIEAFLCLLGQLCNWLLLHWSENKTKQTKKKGAFCIMLDTCFFSVTPKTSLSRARFLVLQLTTGEFAAPPSLCPIFCHPQVLLYVLSCAAPSRGLVTFYMVIVCAPYKDMSMRSKLRIPTWSLTNYCSS